MGEAYSKTGVPSSAICKEKRRSAHGYIWIYKEKWNYIPPILKQHQSKGKPSNNRTIKAPLSN